LASTQVSVNMVDEVTIKKKNAIEFIATEFAVYVSQIFMFFIVAVLTSNMLKDEGALTSYANCKINEHSLEEVGYIIAATLFTIGCLSLLAKNMQSTGWLEALSDEVLNEAPRAIYFFGSSGTGTIIAATLFVHNHPAVKAPTVDKWVVMAVIFGVGAFVYGCGMSYWVKRKTLIK
jgi:di/tricarboxylate transporter